MNSFTTILYILVAILIMSCAGKKLNDGLMEFYGTPIDYEPEYFQLLPTAAVSMECSINKSENIKKMENFIVDIVRNIPVFD